MTTKTLKMTTKRRSDDRKLDYDYANNYASVNCDHSTYKDDKCVDDHGYQLRNDVKDDHNVENCHGDNNCYSGDEASSTKYSADNSDS